MDIYSLIQPHTIKIYNLLDKSYEIKRVPARELLKSNRFDLFAKLFYIKQLQIDNELATKVYFEHIKAFNPNLKEPGRNDKNSLEDFISTFNNIISSFKTQNFDETISLIPVDTNGIILDGAHRIAALAFYDKEVTIAQFYNTYSKGPFDYTYFKNTGLSWNICDIIAKEMTCWLPNIKIACIWPVVKDKSRAIEIIKSNYTVVYENSSKVSFSTFVNFIKQIYSHQSWTNRKEAVLDKASSCYKSNRKLKFVLFEEEDLSNIIKVKEQIRQIYQIGNHSIHISDSQEETNQIISLILNNKNNSTTISFSEIKYRFKHKYWIGLKVILAKLIKY